MWGEGKKERKERERGREKERERKRDSERKKERGGAGWGGIITYWYNSQIPTGTSNMKAAGVVNKKVGAGVAIIYKKSCQP